MGKQIRIAIAAAGAAALALLLLGSSSALAATGHPVLDTFTTGVGSNVRSVATDSAENIYVARAGSGRVSKYDSSGNPVSFTGSAPYIEGNSLTGAPPVPKGGIFKPNLISDIAVDRAGGATDGYIYVDYSYGNPFGEPPSELVSQVLVYDPTGVYKGSYGINHEYSYCAVNVSQGSGSIYLAGAGTVRRYPPTTGDPSAVAPNAQLAASSCVPPLPAVDSTGAFYGNDFTDTQKWNASAFEAATPEPELHIPIAFPGAIATDPTNDDLYLVREGIRHYDSNGNALEAPFGVPGDTARVAIDGNHRVLSAEFGGGVVIYSPTTANLPVIAEEPAFSSNITPKTAEVTGKVDPDGAGNIIGCEFRLTYGEQTVPCTPAASPGTPITSPTVVTGKFTGLSAQTNYQYRLYVTNANGTQLSTLYGFSTPVAVTNLTTDPATAVTKETADLNASFEGEGLETHYYFEWGLDTEYGNIVPGSPANAGSGSGIQHVAPIGISGLKGNTTYHYRVVASNERGVTFGPDQTLVTAEPVTNLTAEPPSNLTNNSAELRGYYTADKYETHYFFEWGATAKYGNKLPVPPGAMPAGSGKASFPAALISGLEEGVTYHFRIVAENENGKSVTPDATFKTAEPPSVDNLDTREVTTTGATLAGEVNPHSGDTTYHFEWGPTKGYGNIAPVPDGDAGSGFVGVPVTAHLENLQSGITYHFRLVASNQYGTVTSVDQSFSFYPPGCPNGQVRQETRASALPDCRGYELVTPKYAQGTVIFPINGPTSGVATNPAKIAYGASFGSFDAETGEPSNTIADMYISTRTATGWYQKYIGVPGYETAFMGGPPQDWVGNLLQGQPPSRNFLGAQVDPKMDRAINYNLGLPSGGLGQPIPDAMTNAPYVWDTGTGTLIERWPTDLSEKPEFLHFVGVPEASKDFSHFVFSSNEVWAEGGIHSDQTISCCSNPFIHPDTVPKATIYDNDVETGSVEVVSIKGDESTVFEGYVYDLSDDGSHILMGEAGYVYGEYYQRTGWTLPAPSMVGPLYLRVDGEHTYEIAPGKQIRYRGGTADGETVYLTSPDKLTPDDHDTSVDLYAWQQSDESFTRISVGNHGDAGDTDECAPASGWTEKCGVAIPDMEQYGFIFANGTGGNGITDSPIAEQSGDIYFESPEALVGAKGDPGARNLYLYRDGTVRFVAALEPKSLCTSDIEAGGCSSGPVARMQVTPDGAHMAMITNTHITGYDSGERGEMYIFDPETGRFACASCRRDGKPPVGETLASQNGLFLTDDGRAFFVTDDPLVPKDTNQTDDVYEFTEGKAWIVSAGLGKTIKTFGGFVGGQTKPGLVGVSRNGADVYFATFDTLVTQDHNGAAIKIYDARTGGGFPAEKFVAKCAAADECHGPSSERPALAPDRTSADLGEPKAKKTKAKKTKKHKKKHKRKKRNARRGN